MKAYSLEMEIGQPRAKIGELFGDPENLVYWQPGFISSEPIEGASNQHRLIYSHGKGEMEMIETIEVDALPGEYTAVYSAKGMTMRVRNRFEEIDSQRTRWISDNEAQTSGILMKILGLLMPGCFKKQSRIFMENFKAFAETGADVRKSG